MEKSIKIILATICTLNLCACSSNNKSSVESANEQKPSIEYSLPDVGTIQLYGKVKSITNITYNAEYKNGEIIKNEQVRTSNYNLKFDENGNITYSEHFVKNLKMSNMYFSRSSGKYLYTERDNSIPDYSKFSENYEYTGNKLESQSFYKDDKLLLRNRYLYNDLDNKINKIVHREWRIANNRWPITCDSLFTYEYNKSGEISKIVIENIRTGQILEKREFFYDNNNRCTEVKYFDDNDEMVKHYLTQFDSDNRVLSHTSIESNWDKTEIDTITIFNTYNDKGELIKQQEINAGKTTVTSNTYNTDGTLAEKAQHAQNGDSLMLEEITTWENIENGYSTVLYGEYNGYIWRWYAYKYNQHGDIVEYREGRSDEMHSEIALGTGNYFEYVYDDKNNWIKQTTYRHRFWADEENKSLEFTDQYIYDNNDIDEISEREIEYYTSENDSINTEN